MSETPLFDDVAAVNPEIQITVHEDVVELSRFADPKPLRTVKVDRLEFNYDEPYRGIAPIPHAPYSHPSMPKSWT